MYKVSELKPKQTNNNNKKSWEKRMKKRKGVRKEGNTLVQKANLGK